MIASIARSWSPGAFSLSEAAMLSGHPDRINDPTSRARSASACGAGAPRLSLEVLSRLRVLLDIEDARREAPTAQVDFKARASEADVTVDGLYAIRRKWEAERSIASIAPYLERAERQATQRPEDDPVVVAARELLEGDGADLPDSRIASELKRRLGSSLPSMIRLVRRARREDASDASSIVRSFGRALLVDVCAIDRANADGHLEPIAAAMVVERAAGLVLGTAVASIDGDMIDAQRRAVRAALDRVAVKRLDIPGTPSAVELTVGEGRDVDAAFSAAGALLPGIDLRVNSRGPRRFDQRLIVLLGKRMGRLWWRPRSSAPGSEAPAPDAPQAMTMADAAFLVDAEARAHNLEIETNLSETGIRPGWGEPAGAMAMALRRILAVLQDQATAETCLS